MKKLLAAGFLSLAALGMATAPAPAWLLDHFCCSNKCTLKITTRQYNAFTPICFGNLNCVGCCPLPCGGMPFCTPAPPPPPMNCCYGDSCGGQPFCCSSDFGGMDQLPAPGSYTETAPAADGPDFTAPMPTPAEGKQQTSQLHSAHWNMVQPTNYSPGYYPAYPVGYNPQAYPVYGQQMMPVSYPPAYGSQWNAFSGN